MTFDKITPDGNLWAVRYDGETDNALFTVFDQWTDVIYLRSFFKENWSDMSSFYKIKDVGTAVEDTIEDSDELESFLLSLSSDDDLDRLFHPLENFRITEMLLGKEKARLKGKRVILHGFASMPLSLSKVFTSLLAVPSS